MLLQTRPPRRYRTDWATQALRFVPFGVLTALTIIVLRRYPSLPETIPTHLDAAGQPDAYGPRWTLLAFLAVWWLLVIAISWFSTRPRLANYPVELTEANAQGVYREGERMMVWLGVVLGVVAVGLVATVLGAQGQSWILASLGGLVLVTVVGVVRIVRAGGRSDDD